MTFSAAQWARLKQNFGLAQTLAEALATLNVTPAALVSALEDIIDLQTGVGELSSRMVSASEDIIDLQTGVGELSSRMAPVGVVEAFAGGTPPEGWLECDGSACSRTTYVDLFTCIGTTYGAGDGSTTFNLPDLRGEFIRGWANARAVDPGRVLGSHQDESIRDHNHEIPTVGGGVSGGVGNLIGSTMPTFWNVSMQKGSGGTETRPRNTALMYIIKT